MMRKLTDKNIRENPLEQRRGSVTSAPSVTPCYSASYSTSCYINSSLPVSIIHSTTLNFQSSRIFIALKAILSCLDEEREVKSRERRSRGQAELDFNSQSVESIDFSVKETTLRGSVLELQFIWLLSWSIWQLRFWSWPEMLLGITRRLESSLVIFNWPSEMTKSWTNSSREWPLLRVVFCPTSKQFFSQRKPRKKLHKCKL